jgi:hypothetical protein
MGILETGKTGCFSLRSLPAINLGLRSLMTFEADFLGISEKSALTIEKVK